MKRKPGSKKAKQPPALRALRRAARGAVEHAKQTGTPAYVLQGDDVVDIAASRVNYKKTMHTAR
jgi:hypothetical protein